MRESSPSFIPRPMRLDCPALRPIAVRDSEVPPTSTFRPAETDSSKLPPVPPTVIWPLPWALSRASWRALLKASSSTWPSFITSRRSRAMVLRISSRVTVNSILGVSSTTPEKVVVLSLALETALEVAVSPRRERPSLPEVGSRRMFSRLSPSVTRDMAPSLTETFTPVSLKASSSFA